MEILICQSCGEIFNYVFGEKLCSVCRMQQEKKLKEVKEYIRKNNNCTAKEVCKECNVNMNLIQKWIRQEILEFKNTKGLDIYCNKCGRSITTGKMCEKCKKKLINTLHEIAPQKEVNVSHVKQEKTNKMRYIR